MISTIINPDWSYKQQTNEEEEEKEEKKHPKSLSVT